LILISAFISESLVSAAVSESLYTMLYKPVGMDDVLKVVERALARKWLLLVDGARPYASGLAASLRSVGMNVETVSDAEAAIAFAKQNAIDVCVLDLLMAPTDGFAALEGLRAVDRDLDVVAITTGSARSGTWPSTCGASCRTPMPPRPPSVSANSSGSSRARSTGATLSSMRGG
jgi:hypothetical protein